MFIKFSDRAEAGGVKVAAGVEVRHREGQQARGHDLLEVLLRAVHAEWLALVGC